MRLIDADELEKQAEEARTGARDYYEDCGMEIIINLVEDAHTVNAFVIPEGATNRDVIKAMFPNCEIVFYNACGCWDDHYSISIGEDVTKCGISCDVDWLDSPYRKET